MKEAATQRTTTVPVTFSDKTTEQNGEQEILVLKHDATSEEMDKWLDRYGYWSQEGKCWGLASPGRLYELELVLQKQNTYRAIDYMQTAVMPNGYRVHIDTSRDGSCLVNKNRDQHLRRTVLLQMNKNIDQETGGPVKSDGKPLEISRNQLLNIGARELSLFWMGDAVMGPPRRMDVYSKVFIASCTLLAMPKVGLWYVFALIGSVYRHWVGVFPRVVTGRYVNAALLIVIIVGAPACRWLNDHVLILLAVDGALRLALAVIFHRMGIAVLHECNQLEMQEGDNTCWVKNGVYADLFETHNNIETCKDVVEAALFNRPLRYNGLQVHGKRSKRERFEEK